MEGRLGTGSASGGTVARKPGRRAPTTPQGRHEAGIHPSRLPPWRLPQLPRDRHGVRSAVHHKSLRQFGGCLKLEESQFEASSIPDEFWMSCFNCGESVAECSLQCGSPAPRREVLRDRFAGLGPPGTADGPPEIAREWVTSRSELRHPGDHPTDNSTNQGLSKHSHIMRSTGNGRALATCPQASRRPWVVRDRVNMRVACHPGSDPRSESVVRSWSDWARATLGRRELERILKHTNAFRPWARWDSNPQPSD